MKYRSEFKHGFSNRGHLPMCYSKALHSFQEKRANKSRDMQFFFKMFKMRSSRFSKCLKTTWNLPDQPAELTQK